MTLGAGWCEQEREDGSAAKEEFGEHHEPSGQGSFLHLAVKNVWGKSRFWEWFVRAGAVSGGQGCFPPGVWGQQLFGGLGGTGGLIPSCAGFLDVESVLGTMFGAIRGLVSPA